MRFRIYGVLRLSAGAERKEERFHPGGIFRKRYLRNVLEEYQVVVNVFTFRVDTPCVGDVHFGESYVSVHFPLFR